MRTSVGAWWSLVSKGKDMKNSIAGIFAVVFLSAMILGAALRVSFATDGEAETSATTMTPAERVASTPKGELKSPYADYAAVADEGHKKYFAMRLQWLPRGYGRRGHLSATHQRCVDLWQG